MQDIAFFQFSTEEDFSYVLEFSGLDLSGRSLEIKVKDRASNTTRATLTNGSGVTISGSNVVEAAQSKASMVTWPRGEYSADVVDITGGAHSRIMAVRFVYDLPGRLVQGVRDRKAFIRWEPNQAVVTATGAIGPAGPPGVQGVQGEPGNDGINGSDGADGIDGQKGWSPAFAIASDGARRVIQVDDWVGGEGVKPAVGDYVGATGLTTVIGDAVDIRGPAGTATIPDGDKGDIVVTDSGTTWTVDTASAAYLRNAADASARSVRDKLSDRIDVRDWATLWAGTAADRDTALAAAIAEAANGGEPDQSTYVDLPGGSFDISATIELQPFVKLRGAGGGYNHDYVAQRWGTRLKWAGSAGGTMMRVSPGSGSTLRALEGWGIEGLFFDGDLSANIGVELLSCKSGLMRDVMMTKIMSFGVDTNVVATLGAGEAKDVQDNVFENLSFRFLYGSEGDATAMRFGGDTGANFSYNRLSGIVGHHSDQIGMILQNADNNSFDDIRLYRVSGSGLGLLFAASSNLLTTARTNKFTRLFTNGGVYAQGTEAATYPSYNNSIVIDRENGTSKPNKGSGATLEWRDEYSPFFYVQGDADKTLSTWERFVATGAALTAARTWTLPSADEMQSGDKVTIIDRAGGIRPNAGIIVSRSGSDTINGAASFVMNRKSMLAVFISDGVGNWSVDGAPEWISYVPTVSPGSGAYTTISAAGQYFVDGSVCHVIVDITYTDVGSGATNTSIGLPFTAAGSVNLTGQESAVTGICLQATGVSGVTSVVPRRTDTFAPLITTNGFVLRLSGFYRV